METMIARDVVNPFVDLLDEMGPTPKISLILDTNGGQTSAAWRLVNLLRSFSDDLEVLVPSKALSAGTLICLGGHRIVMTKQAALGPIDPSVNHPLSPSLAGNPMARVPVSVEAVRGYLDAAKKDIGSRSATALTQLWIDLSTKIHPLVLGEIFRTQAQIRFLASQLIGNQVTNRAKVNKIINFLCADSGSHDYTINRREAAELGLKVEKPSHEFYKLLKKIQDSYTAEMKLLEPYSPQVQLGASQTVNYSEVRGLVEGSTGAAYAFLSEGTLTSQVMPGPPGAPPQTAISDQRTFEGWRKLP
jgi:hypothetical protein